ncbi:permease prefix domain 1-containing protein [Lacticaseibacillus camelliae]|uniref:permease prefix domain 1-containing protein n=1 Tax=Lacticaseibacillus camelliae TaxID=381742 RepID=UPI0006D00479|nr:permease prefix domain 1-containing protein [Lacticaseibacillus camelliae]
METLNTYLAGLFAGVPDTAATRKAKADLLDLMTDHYHEELALGKSEAEAVGAAITAVGPIDEVLAALDVDPVETQKSRQRTADDAIDEKSAERYWHANIRYALLLGAGVAFCILSIALAAAFGSRTQPLQRSCFSSRLDLGWLPLSPAQWGSNLNASALPTGPYRQQQKNWQTRSWKTIIRRTPLALWWAFCAVCSQ